MEHIRYTWRTCENGCIQTELLSKCGCTTDLNILDLRGPVCEFTDSSKR